MKIHTTTPPPSSSQIVGDRPSHSGAPGLAFTNPQVPERRIPNTISPRPSAESAVPTRSSRTPGSRVALGHPAGQGEDREHDQHLAREHPAPREVGREQTADRSGRPPPRSPPAEATRPYARGRSSRPKFDATSATIAGRISAAPMPSRQRPSEQQHAEVRRDGGGERPAAVDDAPDRECTLAADDLTDLPAGDHQRGHHQRVERDRRLDPGHGRADILGDRGDRHVHHRAVEHHQELARAQRQKDDTSRDDTSRARLVPRHFHHLTSHGSIG